MSSPSLILAIESSCDETSCAVVEDGRRVLSNVVASQIELHTRFGGVVPEIASRAHVEAVSAVIAQALAASGAAPADLAAVAVTNEPGLIGSLLVGLMAAKTLAWAWELPLIGINHVYAHAYSPALDAEPIDYPAAALICSGGHTALYRCDSPTTLQLLGATIDDAAGEAFDKVAAILHLGFPGGPVIDNAARQGNPKAVEFPRSLLHGASLDFSFSGLKTAVLYHVNGTPGGALKRSGLREPQAALSSSKGEAKLGGVRVPSAPPSAAPSKPASPKAGEATRSLGVSSCLGHMTGIENLSPQQIADIAASFQAAVVDVLRIKLRRAAHATAAKTLIIGGGVSANSALRTAGTQLAAKLRCTLRLPQLQFCGDNAAMIAGLAYHHLNQGKTATLQLDAHPTVKR